MSTRAPLYSSSSVSSYPSNGAQASRNTVRAPQIRSVPTVAQSQALRRTVPSCPSTPLMSEGKIATGTPATSQPPFPNTPLMSPRNIATGTPGTLATSQPVSFMRMGSNATTGAKYSSTPSVSTSAAINRTSAPTAKSLSDGVNFGAQSPKTLPATKASGRAAPSTPVLRTVAPPRVDHFVAKPAQTEANRVAQQTGMAPAPTGTPYQSAQRNDKALKPAQIKPPVGDEAKMMPAIPPPARAPERRAATSQVQVSTIADKVEAALNADAKAAKAKEAAEAKAAAKAAEEARAAEEAAKAKEAAEAEATAKAAEEAREAAERKPDKLGLQLIANKLQLSFEASSYTIGECVEVRDTSTEDWKQRVVTRVNPLLAGGLKWKYVRKIVEACQAHHKAPNSSDAGRKAKLAQGLREAADNCVVAREGSKDALRQSQIQHALMEAASGLYKAPSVVMDADDQPPVETQQVDICPLPISKLDIPASQTTMASTPQRKSRARQVLGKLFGRTFSCLVDLAGDCQAVALKDLPQDIDVPAMGA